LRARERCWIIAAVAHPSHVRTVARKCARSGITGASAVLLLLVVSCSGGDSRRPSVTIASPMDRATVPSSFKVAVEVVGFTLEQAGDVRDGAGHLHLMVDAACVAPGAQIPQDEAHRHFSDGSSEMEVELPAGEHTLCLQAGDGRHMALDLTDEITITVVGAGGEPPDAKGDTEKTGELWNGTYKGSVVWDCGPAGTQRGTLAADISIKVEEDGTATLSGTHTVTGSCAGATTGRLTTPIEVPGKRTSSGFSFPSTLWGPPGQFNLTVTGDRATGRLTGPAPGPATITLDFDVRCAGSC
jgi:Domain of unknown function (DUF4399)